MKPCRWYYCGECAGHGTVWCEDCGGLSCRTCGPTGKILCPECQGDHTRVPRPDWRPPRKAPRRPAWEWA